MQKNKGTISLIITAFVYLLFNLRPSTDLWIMVRATLYQIAMTAPFVAGATIFIVAILQYLADGQKMPWDRRLRLFFTIGIIAGFVYAIIEYTNPSLMKS